MSSNAKGIQKASKCLRRHAGKALPLATMAAAFAAYVPALTTFFTALDTFRLIEVNRIGSFQDLARVVSSSLMNVGRFYRPTTNLSFSIDYAIWGLNPFGYHLTDLLLHVSATGAAYFFIKRVTSSPWSGFIGALIFGLHPELVESVPAIARRQDLIAAFFGLCSLLVFIRIFDLGRTRRTWLWLGAMLFFAAAVGGKEIGILTLPIAFLLAWWLKLGHGPSVPSLVGWLRHCTIAVWPYLAVAAAYICFRIIVLGGIGGYIYPSATPEGIAVEALGIAARFAIALVYPTPFFGDTNTIATAMFTGTAVVALVVASVVLTKGSGTISSDPHRRSPIGWLLMLSMPLALFVVARTYSARDTYFAVIPLAGLLAHLIVDGAVGFFRFKKVANGAAISSGHVYSALASGLLASSLLLYAPIFVKHTRWATSGVIAYQLTRALDQTAALAPENSTLVIRGLPMDVASPQDGLARARFVAYQSDVSLTSWLRMTQPSRNLTLKTESTSVLPEVPIALRADIISSTEQTIFLAVVPEFK